MLFVWILAGAVLALLAIGVWMDRRGKQRRFHVDEHAQHPDDPESKFFPRY